MSKTTVASLECRVAALEGLVKHQQEQIVGLTLETARLHISTLKDDRQAIPVTMPNERRRAMLAARDEARRTGKCVAVKFN